ncbi:MAG: hypothetical protein HQL80_03850 [Magnetococcales bacterium]|nr:hypothetical protein [Magnetococcales bacterium]
MIPAPFPLELTVLRQPMPARNWSVHLVVNGRHLASHTPSDDTCRAVHGLVDGVRQLLKQQVPWLPGQPQTAPPPDIQNRRLLLHSVGVELFHLWLAPCWDDIQPLLVANPSICLTLQSNTADVLNIPWELLQWPDGTLLGLDPRILFRRRLLGALPPSPACHSTLAAPATPLTVLFAVASPVELTTTATDEVGFSTPFVSLLSPPPTADPALLSCTVMQHATYPMLQQYVHSIRPQLVCLAGPALISGEQGFFGFEEKDGHADIRSGPEIAAGIFANSGVTLTMIVGREANRPPPVAAVAALCQGLVSRQENLAMGWPSSGADPFFSAFLWTFLHNLATDVSVDQAIFMARQAIYPACAQMGHPAWVLPVLYA